MKFNRVLLISSLIALLTLSSCASFYTLFYDPSKQDCATGEQYNGKGKWKSDKKNH